MDCKFSSSQERAKDTRAFLGKKRNDLNKAHKFSQPSKNIANTNDIQKQCQEYTEHCNESSKDEEGIVNINSFGNRSTPIQENENKRQLTERVKLECEIRQDEKIQKLLNSKKENIITVKVFDNQEEMEIILTHANNSLNKLIDNLHITSYITLLKLERCLQMHNFIPSLMQNVISKFNVQQYNPQEVTKFLQSFTTANQIAIVKNEENFYLLFHFSNELITKFYHKSDCEFYLINVENSSREILEDELKKNEKKQEEENIYAQLIKQKEMLSSALEAKENEITELRNQLKQTKFHKDDIRKETTATIEPELSILKEKYKKLKDVAEMLLKNGRLRENEKPKVVNSYENQTHGANNRKFENNNHKISRNEQFTINRDYMSRSKKKSIKVDEFLIEECNDANEKEKMNESMKNEMDKLKERLLCNKCMVREKNILFYNCQHLVYCEKCAKGLSGPVKKKRGKKSTVKEMTCDTPFRCPVCMIEITQMLEIFIS